MPTIDYMQNDFAIPAMTGLVVDYLYIPAKIIELGTGSGRFSCELYEACCQSFSDFITIEANGDVRNPVHIKRLLGSGEPDEARMRPQIWTGNIFLELKQRIIDEITKTEGLLWLLCDNGDKVLEFNTFSDYLKDSDLIFAHDYSPTRQQFNETMRGKYWDCHEIWDEPIQQAIDRNNLKPLSVKDFWKSAWGVWRKDK